MTKIVYNGCFGGFGLSDAAMLRYAEIKGISVYPEKDEKFRRIIHYWTAPPENKQRKHGKDTIYDGDIERDDPALVQVVEELGAKANGMCANLRVETVPAGMSYRIDEYDGNERVMTVNNYDWKIARD